MLKNADFHGFFLTTNSLILYELIRFKFVYSWSYYSFFIFTQSRKDAKTQRFFYRYGVNGTLIFCRKAKENNRKGLLLKINKL